MPDDAPTTRSNPDWYVDGPDAAADYDVLFEILSNKRRRFMIHYLKQRPTEQIDMGELSTQVAAWEYSVGCDELTYDQRKATHTSLYQYHAPKLADAGLIDYDTTRGKVSLSETGRKVEFYTEAVVSRNPAWPMCFLALSVVAVGIALVKRAEVGLIAEMTAELLETTVIMSFFISAVLFVYDRQTRVRLGADGPPPGAADSSESTGSI